MVHPWLSQREGDAVEGLEGEGGRKVAEDGAAAIEVQDDVVVVVVVVVGCGAWQHPLFLQGREAAIMAELVVDHQ